MKKIFCLLVVTILIIMSAACSASNKDAGKNANAMTLTDLSSREDFILAAQSDYSFAYDILIDENRTLTAWVEKYVDGEKTEVSDVFKSNISANQKTVFLATMASALAEVKEDIWTIAAGSVSLRFTETYQNENAAQIWGFNQHVPIVITDSEILLAYVGSSEDVNIQPLNPQFFSKSDIQDDEIARCSTVYLLKCKFLK